ncbi:phosphotransferase family protein [Amycolatopsis pithecellobii]|uniref:Phosphotransferase n=1 Tax=Amycolatopsis pithecellobii TaxID=664692 RepID=A0A6N7YW35_9PSEU|nr:phosphotransferase family protein [Amycolatopsis pithecellobii]MTD53083.1 phosphotransferase [Amycolatopsis pithecellobii]
MSGRQAINPDALSRYLAGACPGLLGDRLDITKFGGGQSNPTYLVDTGAQRFVLRRRPSGAVVSSAHAVEREARVMRSLGETGFPVPAILHECPDPGVIGSPFILMTYLDGRVFWDPTLPGEPAETREEIYFALVDALADIHTTDIDAAGLGDFGPHTDYFERQISRWSRQLEAGDVPLPGADRLKSWLTESKPADELVTLVHGDFRLDNVIFSPDTPGVLGVIDWELATLGNPLADLSYFLLSWIIPAGVAGTPALARADLAELGIPTRETVAERYFARTGYDRPDEFAFYYAYNLYRVAAILHGIAHRSRSGTASNTNAAEIGRLATPAIQLALDIAENTRASW